jgi:hypothetical protein
MYSLGNAVDASNVATLQNKIHNRNSPRKPSPHPIQHSGKTSNPHGKITKTNPETLQSQTSGSTQAMTVSQYTSTASKSSTITTAKYVNW